MKKLIGLTIAALSLAAVSTPAHASIWDWTPWGGYWS